MNSAFRDAENKLIPIFIKEIKMQFAKKAIVFSTLSIYLSTFSNLTLSKDDEKSAPEKAVEGLERQGKGEAGNEHADKQIKEAFGETEPVSPTTKTKD